jgi:hypothetical protein
LVTERTPEHKCAPEAPGSKSVSVALSGEHAQRFERVAKAYGLEPEELLAYLLEREETPLPGGCVQCRAATDRIAIRDRRISAQRHELKRLNAAIRRGAYGQAKNVEGQAMAAMAALDRLLSHVVSNAEVNGGYHAYWRNAVLATRRVLALFLNSRYPGWHLLARTDLSAFASRPGDILPTQAPLDW